MGDAADKTINAIDQIKTKVVDFLTDYGFQMVGAVIILTIGLIIAWWIGRALREWLEKKEMEPPVVMLAVRVVRLIVVLVAMLQALDKLSVPITPMLAASVLQAWALAWRCKAFSATSSPASPSFSPSRFAWANT